jgi:hypothetical protein
VLLSVLAGLAALVWSPGYKPDPDSYYHVGCARLYAQRGWLPGFPWLPYTALGPSFPNVHLLQHLVLAPVAAALPPTAALRAAPILLSSALVASVFLVLRRWGVASPAAFTAFGMLGAPLLILYGTSVKGGALFFVLLVWFVEAVWARAARRAFALAWLSVYAYVGAPVLLLVALVHAVVAAAGRDAAWWRAPAATAGGLAAGLVLNPFWPGHLDHISRELLSVLGAPATLTPGVFRGGEWLRLGGRAVLWFAGGPAAAWAVLLVRRAWRRERLSGPAAAGLLVALVFLALALASGSKPLYLFALLSVLFVPLAAARSAPWPRPLALALLALAAANAASSLGGAGRIVTGSPGPGPSDYRELASWLAARSAPGEVVVAPWDDFPGLFFFDPGRRYVAGINLEFLLRVDAARFEDFRLLYAGAHPDPRSALRRFDDARLVVARRPGLDPAGGRLYLQLAASPDFADAGAPGSAWSVFRAR